MDPISLNAVGAQAPAASLSKKIDAVTIKPTSDSTNQQNAANEGQFLLQIRLHGTQPGICRLSDERVKTPPSTVILSSLIQPLIKLIRVNQDE